MFNKTKKQTTSQWLRHLITLHEDFQYYKEAKGHRIFTYEDILVGEILGVPDLYYLEIQGEDVTKGLSVKEYKLLRKLFNKCYRHTRKQLQSKREIKFLNSRNIAMNVIQTYLNSKEDSNG
jgi:hypothetical protein